MFRKQLGQLSQKALSTFGELCRSPAHTMPRIGSVRPPTGIAAHSRCQQRSSFRSDQSITMMG